MLSMYNTSFLLILKIQIKKRISRQIIMPNLCANRNNIKLGNLTLKQIIGLTSQQYKFRLFTFILSPKAELVNEFV